MQRQGVARTTARAALALLFALTTDAIAQDDWQKLGLVRIRDVTPFGLPRLDMLPAHAVSTAPGSFAYELTISYQNTWALSRNVSRFLDTRASSRTPLSAHDIDSIFGADGDAYLVDGEYSLLELTLHYKVTPHWGAYLTLPYFAFSGGFLDSAIEGFHDTFGFSTFGRDHLPRDRWQVIADVRNASYVVMEAPNDALGDPVVGVRYSLDHQPDKWNLIAELAAKIPRQGERFMVSTGEPDLGVQMSLQRFMRRNALYLTLSHVYFSSPDTRLSVDQWIPTLILGWETRVSRRMNFVLQTYASRSTVQETNLRELAADKLQATMGLQWVSRGTIVRMGITENLANFNNTPDIGLTLSFARIFHNPQ